MKVQIQPVVIFPDTATQLHLLHASIRNFSPDGFADLNWQLLSSTNEVLKSGVVVISGPEYEGWNDDQPYLMDILLQKLGLSVLT